MPESAKLIAEFDVPYAAGELRAIAFKDGQQIASTCIQDGGKSGAAPPESGPSDDSCQAR